MGVGDNIKRIRKEKKLTQKQLGERLGISQAAIGQFEKGVTSPRLETVEKIASALGVSKYILLDWDEQLGVPNDDPFSCSDLKGIEYILPKEYCKLSKDKLDYFIGKINNYIIDGSNIKNNEEREAFYVNAALDIACELLRHLFEFNFIQYGGLQSDISEVIDLVARFLSLDTTTQGSISQLVKKLYGNDHTH